jgi:transcriptional regulator with XRE-family HTH domain
VPHLSSPNVEAMRLEFARRRVEAKLSFDEIARRSGVSRPTVFRVASGQQRGSLETWFAMAAAIKVPFSVLAQRLEDE